MGRFEEDKKSVVAILFHFKQSTQYSLYIRQLPRILEARQALIDISRRRVEATRKPSGLEGGCDLVHFTSETPGLGRHASGATFGLAR